jgi:hypothetical protein
VESSVVANVAGGRGGTQSNDSGAFYGHHGVGSGVQVKESLGVVIQNTVVWNARGGQHGYIYNCDKEVNCPPGPGACVYVTDSGSAQIRHLTCTGGGAAVGRGVWTNSPLGLTLIRDSLLFNLSGHCLYNQGVLSTLLRAEYSNIFGCGSGKASNAQIMASCLDADPLVAESGGGSHPYTLDPASPCIDAAAPASDYCFEPGPNGCRANIGAWGNTAHAVSAVDAEHCPCDDGEGQP